MADRIPGSNALAPISAFDVAVMRTDAIDVATLDRVVALFRIAYDRANVAYLEKSFGTLHHLALAMDGDTPAGFALGEMRRMDLPGIGNECVSLAGMCCVDPRYRRRGLFGGLERAAMMASGIVPQGRMLMCGRVAHPASFRTMNRNPTTVPRAGVTPSSMQRAVGAAIAAAYGVAFFDPLTFVCKGSGVPIGYPVLEMDVRPEEWAVFSPVDRDRGDSLLGLAWSADPPRGWSPEYRRSPRMA